jgi:hypothetical protein
MFNSPNEELCLLSVAVFVWLGDHEEGNQLAGIYANGCRQELYLFVYS